MALRLNPLSTAKGKKFTCEMCGKAATLACQHCRVTYFCGIEHQSVDWFGIHEKICQLLGSLRTLRPTLGSEDERQRRNLTVQMSQHALIDLCIAEGTIVSTSRGVGVPIEQIVEGEQVYGLCVPPASSKSTLQLVEPRTSSATVAKGVKECVELLFSDGRKLVCTPDHRLLTPSGAWVEADKLPIGEHVSVTIEQPLSAASPNCAVWAGIKTLSALGYDIKADTLQGHARACAFARIAGYMLADGSISPRSSDAGYAATVLLTHQFDVDAMQADISSLGLEKATPSRVQNKYSLTLPNGLTDALMMIGLPTGSRADSVIRLPEAFTGPHCPVSVVREFIGGLFGGGGNAFSFAHSDSALGFSATKKGSVARQQMDVLQTGLESMLASLGVPSAHLAWTLKKAGTGDIVEEVDDEECYKLVLDVSSASAVQFATNVGFRFSAHKAMRLTAGAAWFRGRNFADEQRSDFIEVDHMSPTSLKDAMVDWDLARFFSAPGDDCGVEENQIASKTVVDAASDEDFDQTAYDDAEESDVASDDNDAAGVGVFRVRLLAKRPVGPKRVFDLSVPSGGGETYDSFVANGVIVHNCKNESQKHLVMGQYELAIPGALQSLRFSMEVYGSGRIELVPAYLLLAESNLGLKRYKVAEEFLLYANWSVLKNPECSNELKSQLYRNFGKLYASQGRFNDALKQLALDVYYSSLESGPEHIDTAGGYFYMADVFFSSPPSANADPMSAGSNQNIENALALYDKVVDIWYKFLINLRHRPDESISDYLSEAHIGEAVEMLRSILETRKQHLGANHIATGEAAYALGILKHVTGFDLDARNHYAQAINIYANQLGADNESTIAIQRAIDDLPPVPQQLLNKQQADRDAQREIEENQQEQARQQAMLDANSVVTHGHGHAGLGRADPTETEADRAAQFDAHSEEAHAALAQPPSQLNDELQQHLEALRLEQPQEGDELAEEAEEADENDLEPAAEDEEAQFDQQEEEPNQDEYDDYAAGDATADGDEEGDAEAVEEDEEPPADDAAEEAEEAADEP